MALYSISDVTNVYWAMNDGFKGGRDPMGIQNSSVATYGRLLPGMTNLTGHIRYYSIYCWLLSEYDRMEKDGSTSLHQYNFIRRAELAIAFIMYGQNVGAVIGAEYVRDRHYAIDRNASYDIAEGADYENSKKYWAFKSGAFGQYYLGTLILYGLVKVEEERFYLRDKGKELASAVVRSIGKDVRELFLRCITTGRLPKDDIPYLQPLGLHALTAGSDEWNFLNRLLTMVDEDGSSLRRESVYLMLKDFKDGVKLKGFVTNRFRTYKKTDSLEASFGWYFYYLCEALHYAIESVLCLVLVTIDEMRNPPVDRLMERTAESVMEFLKEERCYGEIEEWRQECRQDITSLLEGVKTAVGKKQYAKAVANALPLLLRLYNEYKSDETSFADFEFRHDLSRQRGIFSKGLKQYVEKHLHLSPEAYMETLIRQVMNEHTVVAVGKMGNSHMDLRKFILENGCAVLVEKRYPNETNPRTDSLHNFLVDLQYLTRNDQLTEIAEQFIEHYGKE